MVLYTISTGVLSEGMDESKKLRWEGDRLVNHEGLVVGHVYPSPGPMTRGSPPHEWSASKVLDPRDETYGTSRTARAAKVALAKAVLKLGFEVVEEEPKANR